MIEYAVITILVIAWAYQTWRKRVWRRRAKGNGFWALVEKQMEIQQRQTIAEWPDEIEK